MRGTTVPLSVSVRRLLFLVPRVLAILFSARLVTSSQSSGSSVLGRFETAELWTINLSVSLLSFR